jgi:hypothetical protein
MSLRGGSGDFFVSDPPPSPQTPLPTPFKGAEEGEAFGPAFLGLINRIRDWGWG